jgi:hypothetical protein
MPFFALSPLPRIPIQVAKSENPMRAEVQNVVEEIKQSVGLLRRSL